MDRIQPTYIQGGDAAPLRSYLSGIAVAPTDSVAAIATHYFCEHRFDLLGSGWTTVQYGVRCRGLEGIVFSPAETFIPDAEGEWLRKRVTPANLPESQRIWRLLDRGYIPIDWQVDFKSGFRWSELTWFRDIRFGNVRGADVKVPWELSRLQHLPQMALEFGVSRSLPICTEIRNQLLDWIATNPPRFGVNWVSTMDVAIRAANMLVAYDLALGYGAVFDAEFAKVFRRSILEHANHIVGHLEWSADFRGNHYFANIAGLLFAAGYLDSADDSRGEWITFAAEELITAVEEQFFDDGSNFEASTSYHRLSAEMAVYSTAFARRLAPHGTDVFPDWYHKRLERMGDFARWMSRTESEVVQVGDNDSGRFFKIRPMRVLLSCAEAMDKYRSLDGYQELAPNDPFPDEQHLDQRHLLSGISALVDYPDVAEPAGDFGFERSLVTALAGSVTGYPLVREETGGTGKQDIAFVDDKADARFTIDVGQSFRSVEHRAFPGFGAFVLKSGSAHLCIRCGQLGQNGIGGHAHNDQLSFNLTIDGRNWAADPGTYLYTPLAERRNEYRSASTHNGPRPESGEPGYLGAGLFRIVDPWIGECLEFSAQSFLGVMHRRASRIYRRISLLGDRLIVEDWAKGCRLARQDSNTILRSGIAFSPGYGLRLRTTPLHGSASAE